MKFLFRFCDFDRGGKKLFDVIVEFFSMREMYYYLAEQLMFYNLMKIEEVVDDNEKEIEL